MAFSERTYASSIQGYPKRLLHPFVNPHSRRQRWRGQRRFGYTTPTTLASLLRNKTWLICNDSSLGIHSASNTHHCLASGVAWVCSLCSSRSLLQIFYLPSSGSPVIKEYRQMMMCLSGVALFIEIQWVKTCYLHVLVLRVDCLSWVYQ